MVSNSFRANAFGIVKAFLIDLTIVVRYIYDAASLARTFVPEESTAAEPNQGFKKAPVLSSSFRSRQGALALETPIPCANDSYLLQLGSS